MAGAFILNYSEIPNSWIFIKFRVGKNIFYVLVYGR